MSWRGIGAFLLFVVVYMVVTPAADVAGYYAVDNPAGRKLIDLFGGHNNAQAIIGAIATVFGSIVGMTAAMIANTLIMEERPGRAIGVAFILLQVAQALISLIALSGELRAADLLTDPLLFRGWVTCVVAWVAFRLPPFKRPAPLTS
jgi:hypothetical protein